jgi:hypothetical protein
MVSYTGHICANFIETFADVLTRNTSQSTHHINDKQQKIYNAMALASVNSNGAMDTSRSSWMTPLMLKQFVNTHQMEAIDEAYAIRLIQASSIFGGSHN